MNIEIKAHIKMVQHPNPTRRSYHVVRDVSMVPFYGFGDDDLSSPILEEENPGVVAETLAKALEQIPGVSSGSLSRYEVSVGIGEAFNWADIAPFVVGTIIRHIYPELDGKTIEISTSVGHSYHVATLFDSDFDDGCRVEYRDITQRFEVPVSLDKDRPALDVEFLFSSQTKNEEKKQVVEQALGTK